MADPVAYDISFNDIRAGARPPALPARGTPLPEARR